MTQLSEAEVNYLIGVSNRNGGVHTVTSEEEVTRFTSLKERGYIQCVDWRGNCIFSERLTPQGTYALREATGTKTRLTYLVDMTNGRSVTGSMPFVIIGLNENGEIDKVTVDMGGYQYPALLLRSEEVGADANDAT